MDKDRLATRLVGFLRFLVLLLLLDLARGGVGATRCLWNGCFPPQTPILMADGTHKAIAAVQADDLVLTKDDKTGTVSDQRVVQVVNHAEDTLTVLHFDTGAQIETTAEYPFYVEGKGWVAAGQLGIGTSIVTRAGQLRNRPTHAPPHSPQK